LLGSYDQHHGPHKNEQKTSFELSHRAKEEAISRVHRWRTSPAQSIEQKGQKGMAEER
jgi:hypothetical protein